MTCSICFDKIKVSKKINCSHIFCYDCINKWHKNSDKCPICRQTFTIDYIHKYDTRLNNFNENKQDLLNELKILMDDYGFIILDYNEKIERFNKILTIIYENKVLLKNKKFKKVVIDKLDYLKRCDEFIGFYWAQKIY